MMLRGVRALLPHRRGFATIVHVRHTAEAGASPFLNHVEIENHSLVADEPASVGGQDLGPAPYDLVLAGLGACLCGKLHAIDQMQLRSAGRPKLIFTQAHARR